MAETVIEVRALKKSYRSKLPRRQVDAVRKITLDVERGAAVGFLGPNGSGKTTTIHCILGFLTPDSGTISVFGRPSFDVDMRKHVGYQPEAFHTYPSLSAEDALRLYGSLSGCSQGFLERAIPEQLERLGLSHAAKRRVATFSKGMVQRLGLAQALLHRPDLLILDEPTAGLDPEARKLVAAMILEEKRRGITIFLSSHLLPDVERLCDRVVVIREGEVKGWASVRDLLQAVGTVEIHVKGWKPEFDRLLYKHKILSTNLQGEGNAIITIPSQGKKEVLQALLGIPVEISAVTPRAGLLEDFYFQTAGAKTDA